MAHVTDISFTEKAPSYLEIFRLKMAEEGRLEDYNRRILEIQAETGATSPAAQWKAARDFGFKKKHTLTQWYNGYKERKLAEAFRKTRNGNRSLSVQKSVAKRKLREADAAERQKYQSIDDAIATLPLTAPSSANIEWVQVHPAINRRALSKNKTIHIDVTVDDLMHGPAGPPPSQAAARMLINAVDSPMQFTKLLMEKSFKEAAAEKISTSGKGDGSNWDYSDDLSEVEEMIREASERIRLGAAEV